MIPILTLSEIKEVERKSSQEHGLSEYDMIMSAGEAVFQSIKAMLEEAEEEAAYDDDYLPLEEDRDSHRQEEEEDRNEGEEPQPTVAFVCGKGHNGADALSAALLSSQAGYGVVIYQMHSDRYTSEVQRLQKQLSDSDIPVQTNRMAVDLP
jgi:NAD(P)H-hydrate repair Nnr-like enzyme with NAD(P)H-hydrate epimerase domain